MAERPHLVMSQNAGAVHLDRTCEHELAAALAAKLLLLVFQSYKCQSHTC